MTQSLSRGGLGQPRLRGFFLKKALETRLGVPNIRHLHISHNAPYLSPKFCMTFVLHFSWVLQPSKEKLKKQCLCIILRAK